MTESPPNIWWAFLWLYAGFLGDGGATLRSAVAGDAAGRLFAPTTPSIHSESALLVFKVSSGITRLFLCARSPAYLSCPSLGPPPGARSGGMENPILLWTPLQKRCQVSLFSTTRSRKFSIFLLSSYSTT